MQFSEVDTAILNVIIVQKNLGQFLGAIPLQKIYDEVKKKGILQNNVSILKHIKSLENKGKIKVENWSVKLL